jgi:hypothetical protein
VTSLDSPAARVRKSAELSPLSRRLSLIPSKGTLVPEYG